ncbi:cation-translocating P-type ATPase [Desulfuromonas thiophila]|uniref:cation-translocating P-type ATPase n=1 Tax=Desulfuromonas thiophila TaxID=57664 RepID=UPI0024A8F59E|nr:HAD-IC family P-type ATPase [Desulfuromonas thiophila]
MHWYRKTTEQALAELQVTPEGLSASEAQARLQQYGPNRLQEEEKISLLRLALHQFTSPLITILLVAAVVTFVLREWADTAVIAAVVLLNALIGFVQELRAEQSVRALKGLLVARARVIREGREQEISASELVPGDLVLLASGARVPADLRLLQTIELRIDEAILTGESLPAEKHSQALEQDNLIAGDQTNMAFMGTAVVNGRARGLVVGTGNHSLLGSIAGDVRAIGTTKAPIQEKIERFAHTIGLLVLGACAALFFIGIALGGSAREMFMIAVAAAVATIPEGLPIVVTIALAVGVGRMARHNAIIRKLPAVETLGSTTVICSDKTGTLTRNEMTVTCLHDGQRFYEVSGSGYIPEGQIVDDAIPLLANEREELARLLRIGLLCNESELYRASDGDWHVDGDPTEGALIVAALKAGLHSEIEREQWPRQALIPFESERGYMASLHRHGDGGVIFVKGAPERVLPMCELDWAERDRLLQVAADIAARGLRVLAMASKAVAADHNKLPQEALQSGLQLAGLQGMIDPARSEVIDAISGCHDAGIRVLMITGDHAITARAIAAELGIIADRDAPVITGQQLEEMNDEELYARVAQVNVYARVAPEHKLRITRQLAERGEIVAMTGDGVNDAPALKSAHIGIAMGKTGTDVAKEASDMVLTDDNFASIFAAVREGRVVFDNLRKVTFFLIPTGVAALFSIIITMLLGLPIPYVPAQLLWINLVTNGLQDVAMAFEPGERGILCRPPRDRREGLMSRLLIRRTFLVGGLIAAGVVLIYVQALKNGASLECARTQAVTTMVFFQFFQAWNSRSETASFAHIPFFSNPFLFIALLAASLAQLAVLYVPGLQWLFQTEPLALTAWLKILLVASSVVLVVEIDKWLQRRHQPPAHCQYE